MFDNLARSQNIARQAEFLQQCFLKTSKTFYCMLVTIGGWELPGIRRYKAPGTRYIRGLKSTQYCTNAIWYVLHLKNQSKWYTWKIKAITCVWPQSYKNKTWSFWEWRLQRLQIEFTNGGVALRGFARVPNTTPLQQFEVLFSTTVLFSDPSRPWTLSGLCFSEGFKKIQRKFLLHAILILNTMNDKHFKSYCFHNKLKRFFKLSYRF